MDDLKEFLLAAKKAITDLSPATLLAKNNFYWSAIILAKYYL
jgi:hypothetical protein